MDETRTWKKQLSPEQATVKIRHYCAFQERTHQEVKVKLSSYGISWSDANQILSSLIEEGFLNEERFAKAFVGGKFRMKGWGRKKIEMELKKRQVSSYSIQKAMREEIDPVAYEASLMKQAEKKWNALKGPGNTIYVKQSKVRQYMLSKGFENNIITKAIQALNGKNNLHNDTD
jgi:regulatory protein